MSVVIQVFGWLALALAYYLLGAAALFFGKTYGEHILDRKTPKWQMMLWCIAVGFALMRLRQILGAFMGRSEDGP